MAKKNGSLVIDSNQVYSNQGLTIFEENFTHPSENITKQYRYIIMRPSLRIVALTKKNEVVFIEEYKYPMDEYILSLPAGTVEDGENFLGAAKRELKEEAGYTSNRFLDIGRYFPMASTLKQDARVILATEAFEWPAENHDAYEKSSIRCAKLIRLTELFMEIRNGKLKDGQTLAALMIALAFLNKG